MKKCPYWSKAWETCMIAARTEQQCDGTVNAGCVHFRCAERMRIVQEEQYTNRIQRVQC